MIRTAIASIAALATIATPVLARARPLPAPAAIDAKVAEAMRATGARGLAVAVIDHGRIVFMKPYGVRTPAGAPLQTSSVMYGASLTKAVFAYFVMRLVDAHRINLDTPITQYLRTTPDQWGDAETVRRYGDFTELAKDRRWTRLTPRILLNHSGGFANLAMLEPDNKLRIHFDPGSRYAYSGAGLLLLQMVLEKGVLGIDVGAEMKREVFDPLGMRDTSLTWRDDFGGREATGWTIDGQAPGHAHQSKVRVAGSMDTTVEDMAKFATALVRGDGLSAKSRADLARPQLAITTASQFPTLQDEVPPPQRYKDLAVGLGVLTFKGPQGTGFMKGGHNDITGNTMLCLNRSQRCVVILGSDVRIEAAFPELTTFILGDTGFAYAWEYGDMKFWRPGR